MRIRLEVAYNVVLRLCLIPIPLVESRGFGLPELIYAWVQRAIDPM